MNADAFRYLFGYHFSENHKIWNAYISSLSYEQFIDPVEYSHGSIRDQIVHIMNVDEIWFSELRGIDQIEPYIPVGFDDRSAIRHHWDGIEENMRDYLAHLEDDQLLTKPITNNDEDKDLILWQVLLHVVNHATDHRAQLLRILHDVGVKTHSQDLIFYVYEHQ